MCVCLETDSELLANNMQGFCTRGLYNSSEIGRQLIVSGVIYISLCSGEQYYDSGCDLAFFSGHKGIFNCDIARKPV